MSLIYLLHCVIRLWVWELVFQDSVACDMWSAQAFIENWTWDIEMQKSILIYLIQSLNQKTTRSFLLLLASKINPSVTVLRQHVVFRSVLFHNTHSPQIIIHYNPGPLALTLIIFILVPPFMICKLQIKKSLVILTVSLHRSISL